MKSATTLNDDLRRYYEAWWRAVSNKEWSWFETHFDPNFQLFIWPGPIVCDFAEFMLLTRTITSLSIELLELRAVAYADFATCLLLLRAHETFREASEVDDETRVVAEKAGGTLVNYYSEPTEILYASMFHLSPSGLLLLRHDTLGPPRAG